MILRGSLLVDQFLFFYRWWLGAGNLFVFWRNRDSGVLNPDHVLLWFDILDRQNFIKMVFTESRENFVSFKHLLRVSSRLWRGRWLWLFDMFFDWLFLLNWFWFGFLNFFWSRNVLNWSGSLMDLLLLMFNCLSNQVLW